MGEPLKIARRLIRAAGWTVVAGAVWVALMAFMAWLETTAAGKVVMWLVVVGMVAWMFVSIYQLIGEDRG